jgi:hypothetical protein
MATTFFLLVATSSPARPDATAGREAYEKGDYRRAMMEWQAAADHNDPDAEFGLGSLYELGPGNFKQDYKQADYWYRKAADQGNSEAPYRLAMIWAAGSDNFPANVAEAYKWVVLAVEAKGVWSSLASDLQAQLDKVISPGQRVEAEKHVTAWHESRAAKKKEETPVAPASSPQPVSPANKTGGTGCPGWPFPTLPCTERFPALPGMPASTPSPNSQRPMAKAPQ